jgi:alpha-glucosidase
MTHTDIAFSLHDQNGTLQLQTNTGRFELTWLDPQVFRIRTQLRNELPPAESYVLQQSTQGGTPDRLASLFPEREIRPPWQPELTETTDRWVMAGAGFNLEIRKQPFGLAILEQASGQVLHEDLPERGWYVDGLGRMRHTMRWQPGEIILGLGEKTGALNRAGRRLRLENLDAAWYDARISDPLYKHIPFLIRKAPGTNFATGIFYHNAYPAEFDCGVEHSIYWGPRIGAAFEGGELDLFFIVAPSILEVTRRFVQLTGLPPLPPRHALGYLGSSMYYTELPERADLAVFEFVDRCRAEQIPVSGVYLSSGYTLGVDGRRYAFQWNLQRFPDPAAFVQGMQARGVTLSPNIKPAILTTHPQFAEFEQQGVFIRREDAPDQPLLAQFWGGTAAFFDFSNPRARQVWRENLRRALLQHGIGALWNDNNEFELPWPQGMVDGDGRRQEVNALRPVLANLMAKTAWEALIEAQPGRRPFVLSRAGFAGLQHYAITWSGDNTSNWEHLRYNIPTMLGSSLSGLLFTSMDLGGFDGPAPEPEMLVRWVQNGVFHPRYCIHSWNRDDTVTEPWLYPEYTALVRAAIQRRYWLLPYLYTLAEQAHRTGSPLVRPMAAAFEWEAQLWEESFTYMLGEAILVPAVLDPGQRSVEVTLPTRTRWIDLQHLGARYVGGSVIHLEAPLDDYPFLLRSGCVLPVDEGRGLDENAPLVVWVAAEDAGGGECYFDDGISFAYQAGGYRRLTFTIEPGPVQTDITWKAEGQYRLERQMELAILVGERPPAEVWLNGLRLVQFPDHEAWESAASGWYFETGRRVVHARMDAFVWESDGSVMIKYPG